MGLFGSSEPAWSKNLPPHLRIKNKGTVKALESYRQQINFPENIFFDVYLRTRAVIDQNIRFAYAEAKRVMPGLPDSQYFQLILNERFGKLVAAYSAGADMGDHSIEDVEAILDNLEGIANGFRTLRDVSDYFIRFHEKEGRFYDPGNIINEVDNICSRHA